MIYRLYPIDYAFLFSDIANRVKNSFKSDIESFSQYPEYSVFCSYDERIEKYKDMKTIGYDVNIIGNYTTKLFVVIAPDDDYDNEVEDVLESEVYKASNTDVLQFIVIHAGLLREDKCSLTDISKFIIHYHKKIDLIISRDKLIQYNYGSFLKIFGSFFVVKKTYNLDKENFIYMAQNGLHVLHIEAGNKVYENLEFLVKVSNSTPITEAEVVKAVRDGLNGKESSNMVKARLVPQVQ